MSIGIIPLKQWECPGDNPPSPGYPSHPPNCTREKIIPNAEACNIAENSLTHAEFSLQTVTFYHDAPHP
jgi:hypothetical protein